MRRNWSYCFIHKKVKYVLTKGRKPKMAAGRKSTNMALPTSASKPARIGFLQRSEQPPPMIARQLREIEANGSADVKKYAPPRRLTSNFRPTSPYIFGKSNSDHKYNKPQGTRRPLFPSTKTDTVATVKSECNAQSVLPSKYLLRSLHTTEGGKQSLSGSKESKYKMSNIPVFHANKTLSGVKKLPITNTVVAAVTATSCTINETVAIADAMNLTTVNAPSIQVPSYIQGNDLSKDRIKEKKKSTASCIYVDYDKTVAASCSGSLQAGPIHSLSTYKTRESVGKENNPISNLKQGHLKYQPLILDSSGFPKSPKQKGSAKRKYEESSHHLENNPLKFALKELATIKAKIVSLEDFLKQQTCTNSNVGISNQFVPPLKTSVSDKRQSVKKRKSVHVYEEMRSSYAFLKTPDKTFAHCKKTKTAVNAPMDTPARHQKISQSVQKQLGDLYDS